MNSLRARAATRARRGDTRARANLGGNVVGDGLARETARCEGARDGDGGASGENVDDGEELFRRDAVMERAPRGRRRRRTVER